MTIRIPKKNKAGKWLEPPLRAPAQAPNVLMIVLDDVGFAQLGCYGSTIDTPCIDALAAGAVMLPGAATGQPVAPAAQAPASPDPAQIDAMGGHDADVAGAASAGRLPDAVRHSEFHLIQAALAACDSRSEAAQRLGISPRTLRYKLARWRALGRHTGEGVRNAGSA